MAGGRRARRDEADGAGTGRLGAGEEAGEDAVVGVRVLVLAVVEERDRGGSAVGGGEAGLDAGMAEDRIGDGEAGRELERLAAIVSGVDGECPQEQGGDGGCRDGGLGRPRRLEPRRPLPGRRAPQVVVLIRRLPVVRGTASRALQVWRQRALAGGGQ